MIKYNRVRSNTIVIAIFFVFLHTSYGQDVIIQSFESPGQVKKWKPRIDSMDVANTKPAVVFSSEKAWKTNGRYSMGLSFTPFKTGQPEWPGIALQYKNGDYKTSNWSKYGEFAMDIYNPGTERVRIAVELRDGTAKNGYCDFVFLEPKAKSTLRINLEKAWKKSKQNVDMENVTQILIYSTRPSGPWKYCIDNFRLLDNKRQLILARDYRRTEMAIGYLSDPKIREPLHQKLDQLHRDIFGKTSQRPIDELKQQIADLRSQAESAFYIPLYRFNFGPKNEGETSGWKEAGTGIYDPAKGYGWLAGTSLKMFEQIFKESWNEADQQYWTGLKPPPMYLNPQQQGLVNSFTPATFRVDLPNGKYRIMGLIGYPGDTDFCPVDMNVTINSRTHRVTIAQHYLYKTPVWKNDVSDGKLTIIFSSNTDRRWMINSLVIWPETDNVRAETEFLQPILDHIQILPLELMAEWEDNRPKLRSRMNVPEKWKSYGMAPFETKDLVDYSYDHEPKDYGLSTGLTIRSALNEIATGTFGAVALENAGETVNLKSSDLTGPGGSIPASAVEFKIVENVPWPEVNETKQLIECRPRILKTVEEGVFDWRPDQARQFYLLIHLPDNIAGGKYNGKITLKTEGLAECDIPVALEIYPFELKKDPRLTYGAYWYWSAEKKEKQARAELADMKEHGFNIAGPWKISVTPELKDGKVYWKFPDKPDACMKLVMEYGFNRSTPYQMDGALRPLMKILYGKVTQKGPSDIGLGPEFYEQVTELTRQVMDWQKKNNLCEVLFYPLDEIVDIKLARPLALASKRVPGARTFSNCNPLMQVEMGTLVDVSCYSYKNYMTEEQLHQLIKNRPQAEAWTYPNDTVFGPRTCARLLWGLSGRKIGLVGLWPWAYQSPQGGPCSPFDGLYPDYMLTYPEVDSPVSTVQYEAIRQGIDDARYLYTLQCLIDRGKSDRNEPHSRAAAKAESEMNKIMGDVPLAYSNKESIEWAQEHLPANRDAIAQTIIELQQDLEK